ncbi:MAG: hypothetical protein U0354_12750 [Candidatus Sericytochromatia bacterium]
MKKMFYKTKILLYSCFILFSSCSYSSHNGIYDPQLILTDVKVTDKLKVDIRKMVKNPYNHDLEYKYNADRGQIIANNGSAMTDLYYAPFTGGPDTIRIAIYDKTDNINLPIISQQVFVQGESVSYVENKNKDNELNQFENGLIKVASIRGAINRKEIGWGRNPVISPDGRFIAYVNYLDNKTSQIIIKDPVGNETNITKDNKSLNLNPSWSKVNTDGTLNLVFSSNRDNGIFHLWTFNFDNNELKQLTNGEKNHLEPSWSPDGSKIAYTSDYSDKKINNIRNLWVLDYSTNQSKQITFETTEHKGAFNPEWSLDSKKIFYSRRYQKKEAESILDFQKIWFIDTTKENQDFGEIVTKEVDKNIIETYPSWSSDNRSISFIRHKDNENTLVSLNIVSKIGKLDDKDKQFNSTEPIPEGDINNIIEARWARQRSFGYSYNNPLSNPFKSQN